MSANEKQIGGHHYNTVAGEQHWDRIWRRYGRGYFVGCATKYIERFHLKNGKEDLEKAIHFLEKLKELEYPKAKYAEEPKDGNWGSSKMSDPEMQKAQERSNLEFRRRLNEEPMSYGPQGPGEPDKRYTNQSPGEPDKRYTDQG